MIGEISRALDALLLVGAVLTESLLLYAGYGGLFKLAGSDVRSVIEER
ncbi:MAG: hypothetical protein ABEJ55_04410 [Halanaeroarchaeum sp.]